MGGVSPVDWRFLAAYAGILREEGGVRNSDTGVEQHAGRGEQKDQPGDPVTFFRRGRNDHGLRNESRKQREGGQTTNT